MRRAYGRMVALVDHLREKNFDFSYLQEAGYVMVQDLGARYPLRQRNSPSHKILISTNNSPLQECSR